MTIINGENAAGGRGITEKIYREFLEVWCTGCNIGKSYLG